MVVFTKLIMDLAQRQQVYQIAMVVFTKLAMDLVWRQFATGIPMVIFTATYPFICLCTFPYVPRYSLLRSR